MHVYNGAFEYLADKNRLIERGKESAAIMEPKLMGYNNTKGVVSKGCLN